jgi:hypothetical protein
MLNFMVLMTHIPQYKYFYFFFFFFFFFELSYLLGKDCDCSTSRIFQEEHRKRLPSGRHNVR